MPLKNRSRVEILYDVVSAAKSPAKKTHLMYRGNLSYVQLEQYLDFILRNGLLEGVASDEGKYYRITVKGVEFLRLFEDMQRMLDKSARRLLVGPPL